MLNNLTMKFKTFGYSLDKAILFYIGNMPTYIFL